VFTVTVDVGTVERVMTESVAEPEPDGPARDEPGREWTVDALAQRTGVPVRTIREYQTLGLLHAPRRVGRVGLYDAGHLRRLELVGRLQARGYSLAGIRDLLSAWRDGAALTDVLGIEPDQLVHAEEPGAPATLAQLAELLPALVPDRLDDLLATGVVEACGPDHYCVPSPSLLQLAVDAVAAGLGPDAVLGLLRAVHAAADSVAGAVVATAASIPPAADDATVEALVGRGRGLLAHGLGRLTLHRLGRMIGVSDDDTQAGIAERVRRASAPSDAPAPAPADRTQR
jgi:DNA-binding transcriptional MerR regulator